MAVYELNGEPSDYIDQLDGVWQGNEYICIKRRLTYNCTCVRHDVCSEDGQVVVTAMDGRVVTRVAIPSGETTTRINTSRMGGGVYNFTVVADGKKLENGKIIIR